MASRARGSAADREVLAKQRPAASTLPTASLLLLLCPHPFLAPTETTMTNPRETNGLMARNLNGKEANANGYVHGGDEKHVQGGAREIPLVFGQDEATELEGHTAFFDRRGDGIVWPTDTLWGFRDLGYGWFVSIASMCIVHVVFALALTERWFFGLLPDPKLRLHVSKIHMAKHGSDTESYNKKGDFDQSRFNLAFELYTPAPHDTMTWSQVRDMISRQSDAFDFFGYVAMYFEWGNTYILLWPEDGKMKKEDIRGVFDGSYFWKCAIKRGTRVMPTKKNPRGMISQSNGVSGKRIY